MGISKYSLIKFDSMKASEFNVFLTLIFDLKTKPFRLPAVLAKNSPGKK